MPDHSNKKPLVLMILDGWGYRSDSEYNAIAQAQTPHWQSWWKKAPHCLLEASGTFVGLPEGQMGNSEVGHMHIGAGRIINQDLTRINASIKTGEFKQNPILIKLIEDLKKEKKQLHVLGLFSSGGVHSHQEHLLAFLQLSSSLNFDGLRLHLFLDGRDTPPQSALSSFQALDQWLDTYPVARLCSINGRYFAMDRDKRWDRTEKVYRLLTEKQSPYQFPSAKAALEYFYSRGIYDEFIPPTLIGAGACINDGDGIFFFNFRADRARQLTETLLNPDFHGFMRLKQPKLSSFISLTDYGLTFPLKAAFPKLKLENTLGEVLAKHDLKQLRLAETEKYAHVTYFFNGGSEASFPGEDRLLIPSPQVATYDLKPQMSAFELTQALIKAIETEAYDVIICNYANADMVGHTGDFAASLKAIETLDQCMQEVWNALEKRQGSLLITADHGNAELMFDETTGQAHTAHTSEPVPFIYIGKGWQLKAKKVASLIDLAPTILTLLGLEIPQDMTGQTLLIQDDDARQTF